MERKDRLINVFKRMLDLAKSGDLEKAVDHKAAMAAAIASIGSAPKQQDAVALEATAQKMKARKQASDAQKQGLAAPAQPVAAAPGPAQEQVPLPHFHDMLDQHDWHHGYADSRPVSQGGRENELKLQAIAAQSPQHKALFDAFHEHHHSGGAFNTPKAPKPVRPA